VNDPRATIGQLLAQGQQLEREAAQLMTPKTRKAAGGLGRVAARAYGIPFVAQSFAGLIFDGKLRETEAQHEVRYRSWYETVLSVCARVSVATSSLRLSGNSAQVVRKLARANDGAKLLTRVRAVNRLLMRLTEDQLVFNADIPELLKQRQVAKWNEERERRELRYVDLSDLPDGFVSIKFPNSHALLSRLTAYPSVREIMEGAIHAASGDAPDGRRQALGSCRRALEALRKALTGGGDWREIVRRVADEDVGAFLRKLYSLLSAKGAHGTSRVSEADVELGMQQTFGALFWMIQHAEALQSPRKKT
jgi:hypothetical protein